jgi:hypothetical protein
MESIHEPDEKFVFDKIKMTSPQSLGNGNFMIKYIYDKMPLYIKPPKCSTKQGIVKVGKKLFCDLIFSRDNESFIQWIENLETFTQKCIYDNRSKWFDVPLEMHDIEGFFTSSLKSFKSGKYYNIRVNIPSVLGKCSLKIYNEKEEDVDPESINENTEMMAIMEIQCVKCSSRSFQIELELKQIMVLEPVKLFDKCIFSSLRNSFDRGSNSFDRGSNSFDRGSNSFDRGSNSFDRGSNSNNDNDYVATNNNSSIQLSANKPHNYTNEIHSDSVNDTLVIDTDNALIIHTEPNDHNNTNLISLVMDEKINNSFENMEKDEKEDMEKDEKEDMEKIKDMNTELAFEPPVQELSGLTEFDINLDEIAIDEQPVQLKQRNDVYYEMYREARRKAKIAKDLALSAYLEAKRIKNTYLLDSVNDSDDSDFENDDFQNDEQ